MGSREREREGSVEEALIDFHRRPLVRDPHPVAYLAARESGKCSSLCAQEEGKTRSEQTTGGVEMSTSALENHLVDLPKFKYTSPVTQPPYL